MKLALVMPRFAFYASCIFVSLVGGLHFALDRLFHALPCLSPICEKLHSDPVQVFVRVPLDLLAVGSAVLTLILFVSANATGNKQIQRGCIAISLFSALVGLSLLVYVKIRYTDVCPWCMAITCGFVCISLAALWTDYKGTTKWDIVYSIGGACAAAGLAWILIASQIGFSADATAVQTVDLAKLTPEESLLAKSVGERSQTYVLFVDFDCHFCQDWIRRLLGKDVNLYVHVVPGRSEFGDQVALTMYSAKRLSVRNQFVRWAILNESHSPETVIRRGVELGIPEAPTVQATDALSRDRELVKTIGLISTPVVIEVEGGAARLLSSFDLKRELPKPSPH
jgi:hypothetical protein